MKVAVTQHKGKMEKIKIRTEQERCISIITEQEKHTTKTAVTTGKSEKNERQKTKDLLYIAREQQSAFRKASENSKQSSSNNSPPQVINSLTSPIDSSLSPPMQPTADQVKGTGLGQVIFLLTTLSSYLATQ